MCRLQWLWCSGVAAPRHVGSSWTRDRTGVPCIARQLTTRPSGQPPHIHSEAPVNRIPAAAPSVSVSNSLWRVCVCVCVCLVWGRVQGLSWLFPFSLWCWGWLWLENGWRETGKVLSSPCLCCSSSFSVCVLWMRIDCQGDLFPWALGVSGKSGYISPLTLCMASPCILLCPQGKRSYRKHIIYNPILPPVPTLRPVRTSRIRLP